MKNIIVLSLVLILVLSLAACGDSNAPSGGIDASSTAQPPTSTPEMNPPMPLPEYPIIDGSSSTVTMHAAIRAYLTDAYFTDSHSQTYAALERLVPGNKNPADVILAVKYYDETLQDINDRGADLVITPIAKEGFVFITRVDNPVNSLTQQQLRDIYSGKIKNWKEVGGNDQKIIIIQRNPDSGSQTAILDFMGDTPLAMDNGNDPDLMTAGSMGDMMAVISMNPGAIGYNIFSWSMGFYFEPGSDLKLVAVDGVSPSNETLADDSYFLQVYTYSYYNRGNDNGKNLTDWLLTAEGQSVIASAGYVGIFGEFYTGERIDFNKDLWESTDVFWHYYSTHKSLDWDMNKYHHHERLADRTQTELLANGKGKAVTVLYLFQYNGIYDEVENIHTFDNMRFIVITRDRGGEWEVINEGAVLSHEDGIIVPGDN